VAFSVIDENNLYNICTLNKFVLMRLKISEHKKEFNLIRKPGDPLCTNTIIGLYVFDKGSDLARATRIRNLDKGRVTSIELSTIFKLMKFFDCKSEELIEFNK
jgi:hypothetical protein